MADGADRDFLTNRLVTDEDMPSTSPLPTMCSGAIKSMTTGSMDFISTMGIVLPATSRIITWLTETSSTQMVITRRATAVFAAGGSPPTPETVASFETTSYTATW